MQLGRVPEGETAELRDHDVVLAVRHDARPLLTGDIPSGVRLTGYTGDATDLPSSVLRGFLDDVTAGEAVPVRSVRDLDGSSRRTESRRRTARGKIVVVAQALLSEAPTRERD